MHPDHLADHLAYAAAAAANAAAAEWLLEQQHLMLFAFPVANYAPPQSKTFESHPLLDKKQCFKETPLAKPEPTPDEKEIDDAITTIKKHLNKKQKTRFIGDNKSTGIYRHIADEKEKAKKSRRRDDILRYLLAISYLLKNELPLYDWKPEQSTELLERLTTAISEKTPIFFQTLLKIMGKIIIPCISQWLDEKQRITFLGNGRSTAIYKHIGAHSTFAELPNLIQFLWRITRILQGKYTSQQYDEDQKQAIKSKLMEEVGECTPGYYNRVKEIIIGLDLPSNFDELLARLRLDIVEGLAYRKVPEWKKLPGMEWSYESLEDHVHQSFHDIAFKLGYGVPHDRSKDQHEIKKLSAKIPAELESAFRQHYRPSQIVTHLLPSVLHRLHYSGRREDGISKIVWGPILDYLNILIAPHLHCIFPNKKELSVYEVFKIDAKTGAFIDIRWRDLESWVITILEHQGYFRWPNNTIKAEFKYEQNSIQLEDRKQKEHKHGPAPAMQRQGTWILTTQVCDGKPPDIREMKLSCEFSGQVKNEDGELKDEKICRHTFVGSQPEYGESFYKDIPPELITEWIKQLIDLHQYDLGGLFDELTQSLFHERGLNAAQQVAVSNLFVENAAHMFTDFNKLLEWLKKLTDEKYRIVLKAFIDQLDWPCYVNTPQQFHELIQLFDSGFQKRIYEKLKHKLFKIIKTPADFADAFYKKPAPDISATVDFKEHLSKMVTTLPGVKAIIDVSQWVPPHLMIDFLDAIVPYLSKEILQQLSEIELANLFYILCMPENNSLPSLLPAQARCKEILAPRITNIEELKAVTPTICLRDAIISKLFEYNFAQFIQSRDEFFGLLNFWKGYRNSGYDPICFLEKVCVYLDEQTKSLILKSVEDFQIFIGHFKEFQSKNSYFFGLFDAFRQQLVKLISNADEYKKIAGLISEYTGSVKRKALHQAIGAESLGKLIRSRDDFEILFFPAENYHDEWEKIDEKSKKAVLRNIDDVAYFIEKVDRKYFENFYQAFKFRLKELLFNFDIFLKFHLSYSERDADGFCDKKSKISILLEIIATPENIKQLDLKQIKELFIKFDAESTVELIRQLTNENNQVDSKFLEDEKFWDVILEQRFSVELKPVSLKYVETLLELLPNFKMAISLLQAVSKCIMWHKFQSSKLFNAVFWKSINKDELEQLISLLIGNDSEYDKFFNDNQVLFDKVISKQFLENISNAITPDIFSKLLKFIRDHLKNEYVLNGLESCVRLIFWYIQNKQDLHENDNIYIFIHSILLEFSEEHRKEIYVGLVQKGVILEQFQSEYQKLRTQQSLTSLRSNRGKDLIFPWAISEHAAQPKFTRTAQTVLMLIAQQQPSQQNDCRIIRDSIGANDKGTNLKIAQYFLNLLVKYNENLDVDAIKRFRANIYDISEALIFTEIKDVIKDIAVAIKQHIFANRDGLIIPALHIQIANQMIKQLLLLNKNDRAYIYREIMEDSKITEENVKTTYRQLRQQSRFTLLRSKTGLKLTEEALAEHASKNKHTRTAQSILLAPAPAA